MLEKATLFNIYHNDPNVAKEEAKDFREGDFSEMHRSNKKGRLKILESLQSAVTEITLKYLPSRIKNILEVGCGENFLREYLLPQSLRSKTTSFDINTLALSNIRGEDRSRTFQGSAYEIPIRTNSIDAIIGFSSFDSLLNLEQAIAEVSRCLKPQGVIIFIQDLATSLHAIPNNNSSLNYSAFTCHGALAEAIDKQQNLEIVNRKNNVVEVTEIVDRQTISQRVDPFAYQEIANPDINSLFFIGNDAGIEYVGFQRGNFAKKVSLNRLKNRVHAKIDFSQYETKEKEVIQWVRLYYLIAKKQESTKQII